MTLIREQPTATSIFHRDHLFIGGEWVKPAGSKRIDIIDPASEQVVGSVPEANQADADRAIAAAVAAFTGPWRDLTYAERAEYLGRIADELEARSHDAAEAYIKDFGGIYAGGHAMAARSALHLRMHKKFAERLRDEPERLTIGGTEALLVQEPVGPVLGIVPWNTTFGISIVKIAPALLAGCPIVIKIAVESPMGSFVIADAIEAAGLPKGLVSFLPAPREALGDLTKRPEFRHISFTGSTPAGTEVMKDAADNVVDVTLELGGKSHGIILDDLDPAEHAPLVFAGTMGQAGQVCTTYSRLFVPRAKESAWRDSLTKFYASLVVGDPASPQTQVGPLVTANHRDKVESYIQIARDEGATILTGGGRPAHLSSGYYIEPTLVADVTSDMRIVREEIFGPVITLEAYDTEDEAITMANDTEYGLAGGIFTLDEERAIPLALRLEAGNISINLAASCLLLPFGGFKKSGIGVEGGFAGVEELLVWKQVQLRRTS